MKKVILFCLMFLCYCSLGIAQWSNSANNYTTGKLGIGISAPVAPLHVETFEVAGLGEKYFYVGLSTPGDVNHFQFFIDENPGPDLYNLGISVNSINRIVQSLEGGSLRQAMIFADAATASSTIFGISTSSDNGSTWGPKFVVQQGGNVGIGVINPQSKLAVNGQIRANEVKVLSNIDVPDYVFENGYKLLSLKEVESYIGENKHLPEIPSAKEISNNGIDLGEMNMKLLKKVEELTLYQIELLKRIEALEANESKREK
jgi:hypothetical protein